MKKQLTDLEKQFVAEAEKGFFEVGYNDDGSPFARGAEETGDLFTLEVDETPDRPGGGSFYTLRARRHDLLPQTHG